jgi:hypothetical protein
MTKQKNLKNNRVISPIVVASIIIPIEQRILDTNTGKQ